MSDRPPFCKQEGCAVVTPELELAVIASFFLSGLTPIKCGSGECEEVFFATGLLFWHLPEDAKVQS